MVSYTCGLCLQIVGNKFIGKCVVLVQIIRDLELWLDWGQKRVLKFLEYKSDLLLVVENISILR